jgi:putative copper resistance protein D
MIDRAAAAAGTRAGAADRRRWAAVGLALACFGLLVGLFLGGGAYATPGAGLPDPGPVVGWGLPVAKLLTIAAATLTVGFVTSAAFLLPSSAGGVVTRAGRRDLLRAAGAALVWAVCALATIVFSNATVLGMPLADSLNPGVFFTYAWEIPQHNAYLFSALLAALIAAGCTFTVSTGAAAVWSAVSLVALAAPTTAAHGTALGDHSLASTAGAVHAVAAALWVGGLIAVAVHVWRWDEGAATAVRRFSRLALVCVIALFASGAMNAYTRLERPADLIDSGYGVIVLIKAGLITALILLARRTRRLALRADATGRGPLLQWIMAEVLVLAATIGIATSLTLTAYPRVEVPLPSPGEELLGFPFPPPPAFESVVLGWYPDAFFLLLCGALLGLYLAGVRRLARADVRWPWGRTAAWIAGVLVLGWATSAGIAGYAKLSVEWHMVQHMALGMLIPILLVLGMPATLALRALRPGSGGDRSPRDWVLWGLHTPYSRLMTNPLVVLALGTFGLYGMYFTPLFGMGMASHVGHVLMGVHFLVSGFLFYWVVLGLDPAPRQVPPWARLILLLVYVSLHGLFAVAIMSLTQPLAPEWFSLVQPPWLTDPVRDTVDGGGVAWAFGEIPTLIVMLAVAVQWARSEERVARRLDRQADRDDDAELRSYNEHLARLAARSERSQSVE